MHECMDWSSTRDMYEPGGIKETKNSHKGGSPDVGCYIPAVAAIAVLYNRSSF